MFLSFLKFLYHSKNQYSVHSPFVYQFLIKGLYPKFNKTEFKPFLSLRKKLVNNFNLFIISDFGAGSKIYKDNFRNISQLTKTVSITPKKAKILFKIIKYLQPKTILELGTCIGLGTIAMQLASNTTKITTVEGCKKIKNIAKDNFDFMQFKNIDLRHSTFDEFLNNLSEKTFYDAIYIDGNHTYQATIDYFNILINHISNDSFMILDDIHWNQEMENAWHEIIQNEIVTVSIDLFYFGLIFFRKEQNKQHFVLRS